MEEQILKILQKLDKIDNKIDRMETRMDGMQNQINQVDQKIEDLRIEVKQENEKLKEELRAEIKQRNEELKEELRAEIKQRNEELEEGLRSEFKQENKKLEKRLEDRLIERMKQEVLDQMFVFESEYGRNINIMFEEIMARNEKRNALEKNFNSLDRRVNKNSAFIFSHESRITTLEKAQN